MITARPTYEYFESQRRTNHDDFDLDVRLARLTERNYFDLSRKLHNDRNLKQQLAGMTFQELHRLHHRFWDEIGPGGQWGWDSPTLAICHPHLSHVLNHISEAMMVAWKKETATCPDKETEALPARSPS